MHQKSGYLLRGGSTSSLAPTSSTGRQQRSRESRQQRKPSSTTNNNEFRILSYIERERPFPLSFYLYTLAPSSAFHHFLLIVVEVKIPTTRDAPPTAARGSMGPTRRLLNIPRIAAVFDMVVRYKVMTISLCEGHVMGCLAYQIVAKTVGK